MPRESVVLNHFVAPYYNFTPKMTKLLFIENYYTANQSSSIKQPHKEIPVAEKVITHGDKFITEKSHIPYKINS